MVEAEGPRKTLRDISVKATIVTPLLSGPQLSGHPPLLKRTQSRSRNERLIFPFITNPYSADTCIKRTRTLKLENTHVKLISCLFIIHFYFIN